MIPRRINLLMLFCLAFLLAIVQPTFGFFQPLTTTGNRHYETCASTSTTTSRLYADKVLEEPSNRLRKAKQLLYELDLDDDNLDYDGSNNAYNNNNNGAATVVPDSYFTNGHLVSSSSSTQSNNNNIVTRWSAGQKVAEPLRKYDPVAAEQLLFQQPTKWITRNIQIALPLGWWAAGVVIDYVFHNDTASSRRAKQLRQAISGLGPAIIKGGQALASRSDLLPKEYLMELQKLQDDVPCFDTELALKIVEQEIDSSFDSVFELVEPEPVAAASIGQVYKARLLKNGDLVALKIQRPNCEEIIALDLYVLRWWSGVYTQIFKWLKRDIDVQTIIDDFGDLIYREIDYIAEAANAQRFNELYAGIPDVFVPKVYSELTTSKVLTMEWVDGIRLTETQELEAFGMDKEALVSTLVQCSLQQILENGFFHADPHAGNLLACKDDGRLCYLDFGMVAYADKSQRNGFLLAVVHIVNRDWTELALLYQNLGFIPQGIDLKPIEDALESALPDVLNAQVSELNFKNVVAKLGDIMYTFPFSLPPFYIAIIRCLGVLEGLAIQVDPKARIISEAYPYVASRVLTDPQDDLQEALQRLALNSDGTIRWERLEGLLDEAKQSSGYDVTLALDLLTNYLISDDNGKLVEELSVQIVEAADSVGSESAGYLLQAARALVASDEVGVVKAFQLLQSAIQNSQAEGDRDNSNVVDGVRQSVTSSLAEVLPEPTPSMKRFFNILELLGASSNGSGNTDPAKFVPIVRKLAQEPRVQRAASEVIARLGERMLSRGLRAAFGLPPPSFENQQEGIMAATAERT